MISSDKFPTYKFFVGIFCSGLWWCVWMGCDVSCSCEEQSRALGRCCILVKLIPLGCENFRQDLEAKEELDWFIVLECWLLGFANIALWTVLWVSTSVLTFSSFVQRFFFIRDICSSKYFSFRLSWLLNLFKIFREIINFFYSRGLINNSQIYLPHKFWVLIFENSHQC